MPPLDDIFHADHCWNTIGVWGNDANRCDKLETLAHCHNCEVYQRAGREIFEREISNSYIEYWTQRYAEPALTGIDDFISVVSFRVGEQWYALPSEGLHEIVQNPGIHRIPHNKNPLLKGLINLRGRIYPCYNLAVVFGAEDSDKPSAPSLKTRQSNRLLVISYLDELYAFPVAEIAGVNRYARSSLEKPSALDDALKSTLISAIIKLSDKRLHLLDASAVFDEIKSDVIRRDV